MSETGDFLCYECKKGHKVAHNLNIIELHCDRLSDESQRYSYILQIERNWKKISLTHCKWEDHNEKGFYCFDKRGERVYYQKRCNDSCIQIENSDQKSGYELIL